MDWHVTSHTHHQHHKVKSLQGIENTTAAPGQGMSNSRKMIQE